MPHIPIHCLTHDDTYGRMRDRAYAIGFITFVTISVFRYIVCSNLSVLPPPELSCVRSQV